MKSVWFHPASLSCTLCNFILFICVMCANVEELVDGGNINNNTRTLVCPIAISIFFISSNQASIFAGKASVKCSKM